MSVFHKTEGRIRRKIRVRKKIRGISERPRLCVFRSSRHIYAQLIDDSTGRVIVSASSISKGLAPKMGKDGGNRKGATLVGAAVAELAAKKKIKEVVFDRNGFLYHGRVKALSEAAREHGLKF